MTTVVSILMSDIVPLRDRGVWQGIINIIYATGSGIGAPLGQSPHRPLAVSSTNIDPGGILADYIGWRWYVLSIRTIQTFLTLVGLSLRKCLFVYLPLFQYPSC